MNQQTQKNIVVIGAGAFGTALALNFLKTNHRVTLKHRRDDHAKDTHKKRENEKYLPGILLSDNLHITASDDCLADADIIVLCLPVQQTPDILEILISSIPTTTALIIASKGILTADPLHTPFISSWIKQHYPQHETYILSGPNFAHEIAQGLPAAATLAGDDAAKTKALAQILWHEHFRLYPTTDRLGVEFCGAVKNVYAIACGICHGLNLGQNAMASLLTRGLAEMKRMGLHLGANADTFLGLAGIGDLMLTCSSVKSRNMSVGVELAQGKSIQDILAERHTIAEGVATANALHTMAVHHSVCMPIADAVHEIVHKGTTLKTIIHDLMMRSEIRLESE